MPGWFHLLRYFFFCPLILRNVDYGNGAAHRNLMDIYLPVPENPHLSTKNKMYKKVQIRKIKCIKKCR
jgi:hypothetical protein